MKEKITLLSPLKIIDKPMRSTASSEDQTLQPDLLYMKSVLVSTGMNKNDDVFLPEEMWKARSTPRLKPVNWEHETGVEVNESNKKIIAGNQIIGVMYDSYVTKKDGSNIGEYEIPSEFDIVNEAVIYKYLFPKTASKITEGIKKNSLFVSMEAWFNKFDYRVGNKIVARNEETAFLDDCLKAYGGNGVFGEERVGRVLRNITFGGVGIVANPANEDSIIHSFTNADFEEADVSDAAIASNIIGEILSSDEVQEVCLDMAENVVNQETPNNEQNSNVVDDYKSIMRKVVKAEHDLELKEVELEKQNAEIESLKSSAEVLLSAFAAGAEALAEVIGQEIADKLVKVEASEFFTVLLDSLKEKMTEHETVANELSKVKAELAKIEEEKVKAAKLNQIRSELGLTEAEHDEKVGKLFASVESLCEEDFTAWLENTKELFNVARSAKKEDMEEEMDSTECKKEKESTKCEEDTKAEADEEITDPEILDTVTASEQVPAGVDNANSVVDLNEQMRSLASALLKANKRSEED